MEIRPFCSLDREKYYEMAHAFYNSDAVMAPIPHEYIQNTFDTIINGTPFAKGYILLQSNEIVGYALTARTFSQEAGGLAIFIEELYIEEAYRSQGLGKTFFEFLFADEPQAKRFRLEVEETNPRAIALYKRLGFDFLEYLQMYKTRI